jgi:pyruvate dehydrogenase E1 component alpha subunit
MATPSTDLSPDLLRAMHRTMLRIRRFEERVGELVEAREVRMPCHLYIGQEAIATGVCAALNQDDYLWGGHRSHGHYLAKGGKMQAMMAEIYGKSAGCSRGRGGSMHLFAPEVGILGTVPLVAATIPLAVGSALAAKLRSETRVAACFFGDGATEEGHFHESANFAALCQLPVIFVCENNFYASHMGLLERRAKDNICDAGAAHGVPAVQLDGNDVITVYRAACEAVQNARSGKGPALLECRTYRWRGHVGPSWDMDVGVKRKDELKDWLPRDPVARLAETLLQSGVSGDALRLVDQEIRDELDVAVEFARKSPCPEAAELREHVFFSQEEDNAYAFPELL